LLVGDVAQEPERAAGVVHLGLEVEQLEDEALVASGIDENFLLRPVGQYGNTPPSRRNRIGRTWWSGTSRMLLTSWKRAGNVAEMAPPNRGRRVVLSPAMLALPNG
jgi:hypothetical protein